MHGPLEDRVWLQRLLEEGSAGYEALMKSHNQSLPSAAYELATRRLRVISRQPPPNAYELWLAARSIGEHVTLDGPTLLMRDLADACEDLGLPVVV